MHIFCVLKKGSRAFLWEDIIPTTWPRYPVNFVLYLSSATIIVAENCQAEGKSRWLMICCIFTCLSISASVGRRWENTDGSNPQGVGTINPPNLHSDSKVGENVRTLTINHYYVLKCDWSNFQEKSKQAISYKLPYKYSFSYTLHSPQIHTQLGNCRSGKIW